MGIIWTIIFGFVVGFIAKFLMPGDNEPKGFVMTAILGIVGSFVGTFLGQADRPLQAGRIWRLDRLDRRRHDRAVDLQPGGQEEGGLKAAPPDRRRSHSCPCRFQAIWRCRNRA